MEEKIINVFFDSNGLPYKDKELQVHFPIVGNAFLGASETTKIRFYYDNLGSERVTWVSVAKLPNGKQGSKVLSGSVDYNGNYVELSLSNWYTQAKGDVYIALQGYQGGVTYTYDSESGLYTITGTPTIQTTGSIKLAINYAPIGDVPSYSDEFTTYQQVLAALGTKVSDIDTIIVVSNVSALTPSDYSDGQVFFNLNDNALYRLSSGTISKYMEWYTKGETNTLLNAKADKVGDLPKYTVSSSDNVLTFINNNDVVGKPIVISVSNQNYIGQFTSTGSETSYVFEFEYLGGPQRYVNANPTNMNITFSTLFGTTYRQNYEIAENKVSTLSSSSTDTQYPSAKCVYDKDVLLQQGIDQSGHSIVASLNSTTYVLTISLKDANGNILGTSQTIDLPLESIVTSATYYDSYTYGGTTYTKVIVLVLSTTEVPTIIPVGDLVSGLVPTSRTIAGIDLEDDISKEELAGALNLDNDETKEAYEKDYIQDFNKRTPLTSDTFTYTDDLSQELTLFLKGKQNYNLLSWDNLITEPKYFPTDYFDLNIATTGRVEIVFTQAKPAGTSAGTGYLRKIDITNLGLNVGDELTLSATASGDALSSQFMFAYLFSSDYTQLSSSSFSVSNGKIIAHLTIPNNFKYLYISFTFLRADAIANGAKAIFTEWQLEKGNVALPVYEPYGSYTNVYIKVNNNTVATYNLLADGFLKIVKVIADKNDVIAIQKVNLNYANVYFASNNQDYTKSIVLSNYKSYEVNNRFLELEDGNIFLKDESYYTFGKIAPNQNIAGWGNRKWMQKCKRTPKYIKVIGGTYINPKFSHGVVSVVEYDKDFNFLKTRRVFTEINYLLSQNTAYIKFDIACYEPQDELNAFEYGTINPSNGQPQDSTNRIRTPMASVDDFNKILIKVGGFGVALHFYDASQNWLGYASVNASATQFPATVNELYALSTGNQSATPKYVRAVVLSSDNIIPAPDDDPTCFEFVDDMDDMSLVSVELSLLSPTEELYEIKNERWGSGKYGFVFSYYPQFGFNEITSPSGTEEQFIPAKSIMYKSGWLMLPKNYSQTGKPVKLIFFAHGSGDFGSFHGEPFGTYTEYIEYLRDEGYAIFDCYDFEFYYDDPYTTNNKGTNYGSPSCIAGIVACYQWVLRNYNVDDSGLFVTAKSAGGYKSVPFLWNKGLPVKAMGLLAPVIWGASSSNFGGYSNDARTYFFTDYGFSSADITTMLTGTTDEKKATLKNNWKKFVGYANELSGLVSDVSAEEVFNDYVDHTGSASGTYKKNCITPLKIWVAVDDLLLEDNLLLTQIQRGGGLAYLRAFPADSGGHHAVDNSPLAPKVASITTKLGITHINVPLAYAELVTWFRRFE